MSLSDTDLELIEASLDGDPAAAKAVAGRGDLAGAVAGAAGARDGRRAFWAALTPDPARADRFVWRLNGAIAGQRRAAPWWAPGVVVRYGSVAAACLVFGFFAGRTNKAEPVPTAVARPSVVASVSPPSTPAQTVLVPVVDASGQTVWEPFTNTEDAKRFQGILPMPERPSAPVSGPVRTVSEDLGL